MQVEVQFLTTYYGFICVDVDACDEVQFSFSNSAVRLTSPRGQGEYNMGKKITPKTATPTVKGRFAKLDREWCVAFPSDVKLSVGSVVAVVTAEGVEKQVKINATPVVLFDVKRETVSAEMFYTFDRIAK